MEWRPVYLPNPKWFSMGKRGTEVEGIGNRRDASVKVSRVRGTEAGASQKSLGNKNKEVRGTKFTFLF